VINNAIPAVYLVLENEKGEYLFTRRFNTGWGDGYYSLPAGHMEEGESPMQSLIREVKEEIGLDLSNEKILFKHVMYRQSNTVRVDFFFSCKLSNPQVQNCEPNKCNDFLWSHNLPKKTLGYIVQLFKQIKNNSSISYFKSA
jgi:8-oxo-dGTP pyrophosphatase MutT (NUDIX family)